MQTSDARRVASHIIIIAATAERLFFDFVIKR